MKLFSIVADNYHAEVFLSTFFINQDGQLSEKKGNYIFFINDHCYEFTTADKLYRFIKQELDCIIDPLPY